MFFKVSDFEIILIESKFYVVSPVFILVHPCQLLSFFRDAAGGILLRKFALHVVQYYSPKHVFGSPYFVRDANFSTFANRFWSIQIDLPKIDSDWKLVWRNQFFRFINISLLIYRFFKAILIDFSNFLLHFVNYQLIFIKFQSSNFRKYDSEKSIKLFSTSIVWAKF